MNEFERGRSISCDCENRKGAGTELYRRATSFAAWLAAALFVANIIATPAAAQTSADPFALHQAGLAAERRGNMTLAIDRFDRACAMKLAPSCTMAGLARLDSVEGGEALLAAARDLAAGCLAGSDFACAKMGVALGKASAHAAGGEGFVAIALLQMGEDCRAAPDGGACHDGGALLRAEERGGADMDAVRRYAAKACAREARSGCLPAAASTRDQSQASRSASTRCRSGRADGCTALLDLLLKVDEQPAVPNALTTLEQACADRVGIACTKLGLYYAQGPVAARDDGAARRFIRAGCDGAVAQACFVFAEMHRQGLGGPVNEARSLALVRHACDLGSAEACETLAAIIEDARAPSGCGQDPIALRQRACRLGSYRACGAKAPLSPPPA